MALIKGRGDGGILELLELLELLNSFFQFLLFSRVVCAGFGAIPAKAISPGLWQNDLARAQAFVIGPWELYQPPLFFGRAHEERELRLLVKQPDAAALADCARNARRSNVRTLWA